MTLTLRPAVAGDLMAIGDLHHRSRSAAYREFVPADALASVTGEMMGRYWTERWTYERDSHLMTVAERNGRLVGFTYLGPHDPEEPDSAGPDVGELYAIHLDPAEQGRGVGRALMVDALAKLHARGWRRAVLWVLADNTHARSFYVRGGWVPDGVEREGDIGPVLTRQLRHVRNLP
ncbi:GNAT family N-acetyltransferase [Plantactinospora sp. S1510]|uniref:GNAT family N-acetyltransferase n=1 Tax=Plantactinospora alkalitolerans TaxID=2789879 RepID=A0ABS0GRP4_9ACTN|nr:GNAT family N-acetyltransferase [Plantactinospora alkalitolerans]MBF9128868.1 GNAT family N-acetyltransferase [Plantactinospora alkalitolerans]